MEDSNNPYKKVAITTGHLLPLILASIIIISLLRCDDGLFGAALVLVAHSACRDLGIGCFCQVNKDENQIGENRLCMGMCSPRVDGDFHLFSVQ